MDRKGFFKTLGAATAAVAARPASATQQMSPDVQFIGVLTDTTRCIGCRACERACAVAHDLPVPDVATDNALDQERSPVPGQLTVVNRYDTQRGEVFVKKQCMHCWQPACAAACLTNAMEKRHEGPVTWDGDRCMGCRFCMVSCPFNIPTFEYDEWNPRIQKCDMCWERLQVGEKPACVAACPTDALMFGTKKELMEIARVRIYNHPERYVHHIYGEHEVGGTGWLYLAGVPFDQLGFRTDLGTTPSPEYTRDFLYSVPVALFGLPALLLGLNQLARDDDGEEEAHT